MRRLVDVRKSKRMNEEEKYVQFEFEGYKYIVGCSRDGRDIFAKIKRLRELADDIARLRNSEGKMRERLDFCGSWWFAEIINFSEEDAKEDILVIRKLWKEKEEKEDKLKLLRWWEFKKRPVLERETENLYTKYKTFLQKYEAQRLLESLREVVKKRKQKTDEEKNLKKVVGRLLCG